MQRFRTLLGLGVALLVGNATLLLDQPLSDPPRFLAAVALIFVLPGWAWLPTLGWLQTRRGLERLVLIFGASSILSALALLATVFLPGPFTEPPTLIALNLVTLTGFIAQVVKISLAHRRQGGELTFDPAKIEWPSRTVLLILLTIVAVAAFTRLTRIGYAEFHEDELENMRLIIRAYKGEEYAPFLDSKGPIHWLLPAALWYANGWINEGLARTPFALAALMLVPLMYTLGRRLGEGRDSVGLAAAGFVALNGFFVALARHVEIRSLLIFWGALVVWCSYRYYKEGLISLLLAAALTLGVGLIAHPLMLLYLPVPLYAVIMTMGGATRTAWRQQWPWQLGASLIFLGLTAAFYVPYFLDPNIDRVFEYFTGERIGESLLYNRVDNMLGEDELYSSRYHAPILILLLTWLLARHFARWGRWGWVIFSGGGLLILSTVLTPQVWVWGNLNAAFVPYALLTLLFLLLPQTSTALKLVMLWFAVPFGGLLFLAQDASNHIQMAYPAWAVLAATALVKMWNGLSYPAASWSRFGPALKAGMVLVGAVLVGLILFYQYLSFDAPVTTYWRAKVDSASNPTSLYNRIYRTIPRPRKIIANPRLGGWKAVGYLWETGILGGDFRSVNESFAVPIWYTFQTPRSCYDDPQNSWVRRDWQGWPEEEERLLEQGYSLTRVVLVDQEPKLHLYEKNGAATEPEIIDSEAYRRQFDRLATPARYAREQTGQQPTAFNFGGDRLRLLGYDFPDQPITSGQLVPITVYWETLAPMNIRYRAFMHLIDTDGRQWGQHDDDPACRLLTTDMRPGQRSSRQFRLPVAPDAPAGDYSVIFGLYDPANGQRLEIWDAAAAKNVGDHLVLGQLTVQPEIDESSP